MAWERGNVSAQARDVGWRAFTPWDIHVDSGSCSILGRFVGVLGLLTNMVLSFGA